MSLTLYQSVNQRWSPFAPGCIGVRCFSGSVHADHQLTRPDGCLRKTKKPVTAALGGNPLDLNQGREHE